jgi:hypothetical protein
MNRSRWGFSSGGGGLRAGIAYPIAIDSQGLSKLPMTPEIMEAWRAVFNGGEPIRDIAGAVAPACHWNILQEAADRVELISQGSDPVHLPESLPPKEPHQS